MFSAKEINFTPSPFNVGQEEHTIKWIPSNTRLIDALDLEHPAIRWIGVVKKYYGKTDINTDNVHFKNIGILMDNMDNFNHQDHPPSFEEGELRQQVSENQPIPEEMKPPAKDDNFTPQQLKSKRRRASLPSRFKMDDRNSVILHT